MTLYIKQVGGTHYETAAPGLQHWDVIEAHDVAYLEAVATKYVVRWRDKGGVEDLKKSVTYLQKMEGRATRRKVPSNVVWDFCQANRVGEYEQNIIELVLSYGTPDLIIRAIENLQMMIEEHSK